MIIIKPSTSDTVWRWRTFSINSLMFLVLCAAVMLGGYRFGYDRGSAAGKDKRRLEVFYLTTYYVGDLVGAPQQPTEDGDYGDYDTLVNMMEATISPTSWDIVGGEGSVQPVPRVRSLVVLQKGGEHDTIEELLSQLRDVAEKHGIDLTQPAPRPLPNVGGVFQFEGGGVGFSTPTPPETQEPRE